MDTLLKTGVVVCAALMLVMAGCSDTTAPPTLLAPDAVLLAATASVTYEREFSTITPINAPSDIDIQVVRYGTTAVEPLSEMPGICTDVTITIVVKSDSGRRPNQWQRSPDPDRSGEICSYVEEAGRNLYHVYYEFTLFEGSDEKGRFLARETARCNRLPCETKADVEVLKGLGDFMGVFANPGFDALVQTFRCELYKEGDDYLLDMSPLGGNLVWTQ